MQGMIGIVAAEDNEIDEILNIMKDISVLTYQELKFYIGKINNSEVVATKSGVGKVNAARTVQALTDRFRLDRIINVGAAGAVDESLNVYDVVIGTSIVQYDFDLTALGYEKGDIFEVGKYFDINKDTLAMLKSKLKEDESFEDTEFKIVYGNIGTADLFLSDIEYSKKLKEEFDLKCVEMEAGAMAQVCYLNQKDFICIRGISDVPNGKNKVDYRTYSKKASRQVAKIILKITP